MIYSRWGSPVKIVEADMDRYVVDIEFEDGDQQLDVFAGCLKADDGINEIDREMKLVSERVKR